MPGVLFCLFGLAKTYSSVMGEKRLMHLVLLVEFAMPSAAVRAFSSRLKRPRRLKKSATEGGRLRVF